MVKPNMFYADLKDSYLFYNIAQKTKAYLQEHPSQHLYRMGIGDVSLPLCPAVITALHEAVDDQACAERFHGYMPECGAPFLRAEIAKFMKVAGPMLQGLRFQRTVRRDKEHRYFKCPNCGQYLRVPRGKGRITVTCRGCGASFQEKS